MIPLNGPARRLLHLYWRVQRGMTLGVRGLCRDAAGRVLLVEHSYVPGWHLPGGGVEPGRALEEALADELREEANVVLLARPRLVGVYANRAASRRDHVALYDCAAVHQTAPRAADREIIGCGFYPLDALPEGTTAATRRRIAEVVGGLAPAVDW